MNKLLLLALVAILAVACNEIDDNAGKTKASGNNVEVTTEDPSTFTTIQWIDSVKSFGKINEGQQLQVSFRFKNTGDKPLVIRSVRASCGCTATDPPTAPIQPGAEGTINASFNSQGREGINRKEIYVEANTQNTQNHTLHFDVDVVKAKE